MTTEAEKENARIRQEKHRAKQSILKDGLLPMQKRFVDALTRKQGAPEIGILCTPRAQGKSWLCGRLIGRSLTPGDDLHESSVENVLVASSRSQAQITLEFARQALAEVPGIRWSNDGGNPRGEQGEDQDHLIGRQKVARPGRTCEVAFL